MIKNEKRNYHVQLDFVMLYKKINKIIIMIQYSSYCVSGWYVDRILNNE